MGQLQRSMMGGAAGVLSALEETARHVGRRQTGERNSGDSARLARAWLAGMVYDRAASAAL
ncbi:MAG TPA: hypothetical protein VGO93_11080 [Candidatus Xenobia bacterium]